MGITGAIFDCDGTLVDSMPMWHNVVVELLRDYGVPNVEHVYEVTEPLSLGEMCEAFHSQYGVPLPGEQILAEVKRRVREAYRTTVPLIPGCGEFLRSLRDAGVRMIVASSTTVPEVRVAFAAHGIEDCFDDVICAGDVGRSKDYPDVYLEALRRLGTNVQTTWLFEDAPFGLRTARRVGLRTVCIYNDHDGRDEEFCRQQADIFSHGYVDVSLPIIHDFEPAPTRTDGIMRALLVDGSPEPSSTALVQELSDQADFVVAVDRGARALLDAGVRPDLLCGDADSVDPEALAWARSGTGNEIEYPSEKYCTDLSIAVSCARHEAARRGAALRLTVTCATGGRPDHALAALGVLVSAADACPRIVEDSFECQILSPDGQASWRLGERGVGRTFSAIAVAPGTTLSERGLKWELDHKGIPLLGDQPVSNVVVDADAMVTCDSGAVAAYLLS